ncbi:Uncharacterised protein [Streptococcus pneumoniae]|nr:Uncharacterised protein [Streptococcus pneumoniae]VSX85530.1 Uncharacterised protein [Streptococcus pneumoniae]
MIWVSARVDLPEPEYPIIVIFIFYLFLFGDKKTASMDCFLFSKFS